MLQILFANLGTILVLLLLAVVVGLIVRHLVRQHKRGGCAGCSGGCGSCTACHTQPPKS